MLNTRFPRLPEDIGNPETFGGQVIFEFVERATVSEVVIDTSIDPDLEREFVVAAKRLENQGAKVIGTSCGFLVSLQDTLQSAVNVPVMTSSLSLIPELRKSFGEDSMIGILTFDKEKLAAPCYGAYLDSNCVLNGLRKDGELYQCISRDRAHLDSDQARKEVIQCASELIRAHSNIELFLIECTNISPYKEDLLAAFDLPVFDLVGGIRKVEFEVAD